MHREAMAGLWVAGLLAFACGSAPARSPARAEASTTAPRVAETAPPPAPAGTSAGYIETCWWREEKSRAERLASLATTRTGPPLAEDAFEEIRIRDKVLFETDSATVRAASDAL